MTDAQLLRQAEAQLAEDRRQHALLGQRIEVWAAMVKRLKAVRLQHPRSIEPRPIATVDPSFDEDHDTPDRAFLSDRFYGSGKARAGR